MLTSYHIKYNIPFLFLFFFHPLYFITRVTCYIFKPEAVVNWNHIYIVLVGAHYSLQATLGATSTMPQHQLRFVNLILFNDFIYLDFFFCFHLFRLFICWKSWFVWVRRMSKRIILLCPWDSAVEIFCFSCHPQSHFPITQISNFRDVHLMLGIDLF